MSRRKRGRGSVEPLSPERRWRTLTAAALPVVPAFWSLLAALVAAAGPTPEGAPAVGPALALGLSVLPFAFLVLALGSGAPNVPRAVLKGMGMALLVGIPVSALAADAVSGLTAGVGAGAAMSLRLDEWHSLRARLAAVAFAVVYVFVLVRAASALALLPAPVLPLIAVGLADHWSEARAARRAGVLQQQA